MPARASRPARELVQDLDGAGERAPRRTRGACFQRAAELGAGVAERKQGVELARGGDVPVALDAEEEPRHERLRRNAHTPSIARLEERGFREQLW